MIASPIDADCTLFSSCEAAADPWRYGNFEHLLVSYAEAAEARARATVASPTMLPFARTSQDSRSRKAL